MFRKCNGHGVLALGVATLCAGLMMGAVPARAAAGMNTKKPCRAAVPRMQPRLVRQKNVPMVVETANFRIYGLKRPADAAWCGQRLEALRTSLQQRWLSHDNSPVWSPKCDFVVHATLQAYLRQAGADAGTTLGASHVEFDHGRVAMRRIDVRADRSGWFDAVVPHELTHIVLADEFPGGNLPAWADEGMAVLADSPEKQSLHLRDLNAGQRSGSTFRLVSFVGARGYPSLEKIPVFYGQSVSIVKFLVGRGSPADFVRFLHLAEKEGYDAALAEAYGLESINSLEHEWLASSSTLQRPNVLKAEKAQDRDFAVVGAFVTTTTTPSVTGVGIAHRSNFVVGSAHPTP